jgi:hypothetical protein
MEKGVRSLVVLGLLTLVGCASVPEPAPCDVAGDSMNTVTSMAYSLAGGHVPCHRPRPINGSI